MTRGVPSRVPALTRRTTALTAVWLTAVLVLTAGPAVAGTPPTPGAGGTPSATPSPGPPPTPTPTVTPSPSLTPSPTPSATPSPTAAPSPSPVPPPSPPLVAPADPGARQSMRAAGGLGAATAAAIPSQVRISGSTRHTLAVAVSKATFPRGARTVVIVSSARAADQQIAAYVAGSIGAPMLLVDAGSVPGPTAAEVARLAPDRIVVMGSRTSVSDAVVGRLSSGRSMVRVDGGTTMSLSQAALTATAPTASTVYLVDVRQLATAPLAAATAAGLDRGFMIVEGARAPSPGALATLKGVGAREIVFVNGVSGLPTAYGDALRKEGFTVRRLAGDDRVALALSAAAEYPASTTRGVITASAQATGFGSPTATALAATTGQPLYFGGDRCLSDSTANAIRRRGDRPLVVGPTSQLRSEVESGQGCTAVRTSRQDRLRAALQSTLQRHSASSFTVTVREVGGLGEAVALGGATRREPASMMKLYAAWATYKRIEAGRASLSTRLSSGLTVGECLREMIWMSDNFCHTDLVHWIGLSQLNKEIAAAGFSRTAYGRVLRGQDVLYAGNRTTSDDLTALLKRLEEGRLLTPTYTRHMLNLMHTQLFRSRIPNGLPASAYQASKPGSLWVSGGLLQADSAVVRGPQGRFVITVIGAPGATKAGIRDVARTVYSHFNGSFGAAANHSDLHVRTVRNTPWYSSSAGGRIVGTIPSGTRLQISDSRRHWYKVHWRGGYAWLYYHHVRSNLAY